jgi:hypothetical protein
MFNGLRNKATALSAVVWLGCGTCLMQPALAGSEKSQSDVDATKLSKDDNQHQLNPSKNSHKKGTPLPFEGPPAKSNDDDKSAKKAPEDKKP